MSPEQKLREEGFFRYNKRRIKGKCLVSQCGKSSNRDAILCARHSLQRWRSQNQEGSTYATLRDHARERGIAFTISIDYWRGLTDAFSFYSPPEGEVLSIDRVDPARGYEPGNLRVVSLSVNVAKGNRERYLPEHVQERLERQRAQQQDDYADHLGRDGDLDDCPF
jgi:hypothetical protein